jgi:hypothetical protein
MVVFDWCFESLLQKEISCCRPTMSAQAYPTDKLQLSVTGIQPKVAKACTMIWGMKAAGKTHMTVAQMRHSDET